MNDNEYRLEEPSDVSRGIVHVDVDAFYAQVRLDGHHPFAWLTRRTTVLSDVPSTFIHLRLRNSGTQASATSPWA